MILTQRNTPLRITLALAIMFLLPALHTRGQPATDHPSRPAFSWDTVPLYMHIGKRTAFTDEEIAHIARYPLITIEKATGLDAGSVEAGTHRAARRIKAANPDATVLAYFNVLLDYPGYAAREKFKQHPEWVLRDKQGEPILIRNRVRCFDLANPRVREWWVDSAEHLVRHPAVDGLFVDALVKVFEYRAFKRRLGPDHYEQFTAGYRSMMAGTRRRIGSRKLMIANLLRARFEDGGLEYLNPFHGSYMERFERFADAGKKKYEEWVSKGIRVIREAAGRGKIIALSLTPSEAALGPPPENPTRAQRLDRMKRGLEYALALYLIAAGEGVYFRYHNGYRAERAIWRQWYPEYDRPLGPPLGPPQRTGSTWTREYEHCRVTLDLGKRKARINWSN